MRLLLLSLLLLAACAGPTPTSVPPTLTPFAIATAVGAGPTATVPVASPTPPAPAATPTDEPAGLGYVTGDSPTAGVQAAVETVAAELGWPVATGQAADSLTTLAQAGAQVIVADGPSLEAATRAAAQAFPNTHFIGLHHAGAEPALPNLLALGVGPAREDQLGFVAGAIGGYLTQGQIVTAIGAPATPAGLKYRNGFLHGIRFTCTRCRVDFVDSIDGVSDAVAVAERARLNANLSSDVVYAAAGPAGLAGLQAAAAQGAWIIGADPTDAATFAPGQPGAGRWVTSVYFDPAAAVAAALRAHHAGAPLSGALPWSAASGALVIAPYTVDEDVLSDLDRQDLDAMLARLADGSLETGIDPLSGQER